MVKARSKKAERRRQPQQQRALRTIDVILSAVVRVIKREGVDAVTTNHVAKVAGVSVGSVYQYFPDKGAMFTALHDRHVQHVCARIDTTLVAHAAEPLPSLLRALIKALVDAHAPEPELYTTLAKIIPDRSSGSQAVEARLQNALRLALAPLKHPGSSAHGLERSLFTVAPTIEALTHAIVLARPRWLTESAAIDEAVRMIVAYIMTSEL